MALTTLDKIAEGIAPTRATTNYFDPAAGQSVMSRYANAGRRVADSELAAEAGSRLLQSRADRLATRKAQVAFDRDEEDYKEKQDFKIQRGNFLTQIAAISPEADDFEDQISQLYTTLPQAALQDDAVVDMLHAKRATATDLRNERQAQTRRAEEQANRLELMRERYARDSRLSSLTPEERNQFIGPDGEFDSVGAAQLAYQKSRQDKKDDQIEVAKAKEELRLEHRADKDLTDAQKTLRTAAKEATTGDAEAFPDQVEILRQKLTKNGKAPDKKTLEKDPGFAAANDYEKNKFVAEMESARKMPLSDYLKLGGQSEAAQKKRQMVWEAANPGGQAAPAAAAPAPAGDKFVVGKRYRDSQGREKTYKGDGKWE